MPPRQPRSMRRRGAVAAANGLFAAEDCLGRLAAVVRGWSSVSVRASVAQCWYSCAAGGSATTDEPASDLRFVEDDVVLRLGGNEAHNCAASVSSASRPVRRSLVIGWMRSGWSRICQLPCHTPSTRKVPAVAPSPGRSGTERLSRITRVRSLCDSSRLSYSDRRRGGAGMSSEGRGASGRSYSACPASPRTVRNGNRSATSPSRVSPEHSWMSATLAGPNAPR